MPKKKQESKAKTTSKSRKARAVRKVEASIPDKSKSKIRSDRILQKARDFLDKGKNEKA
nr:hypothetical protein [candidate division Zixibacteria bacterium]